MEVIVSSGYGAGWSTWNMEHKIELATNEELIKLIKGESTRKLEDILKEITGEENPSIYMGGFSNCKIKEVPEGEAWWIDEYDGYESLHYGSSNVWGIAGKE